jgi:hypothetical protein
MFLTEFIPGVATEYGLLKEASGSSMKMEIGEFQMDVLIFSLHCLDRTVLANFGAEYRRVFMDHALSFVCGAFSSVLPKNAQEGFSTGFEKHYRTRQCEYSAMMLPLADNSPKGTLFYEYAVRLCRDAGVDNPVAVQLMMEEAFAIFKMMDAVTQTL